MKMPVRRPGKSCYPSAVIARNQLRARHRRKRTTRPRRGQRFGEAIPRCFPQRVQTDWQERFDAMFTPGNGAFSGHLPTLVTSDDELRRMYYMSAVSLLSVCRTSFPMAPRVYVSNSPESNCTMMYFWDTREWATALALLDPDMLKQYLCATGSPRGFTAATRRNFKPEHSRGRGTAPMITPSSCFLDSYLNVTGDKAFLSGNNRWQKHSSAHGRDRHALETTRPPHLAERLPTMGEGVQPAPRNACPHISTKSRRSTPQMSG